MASLVATLAMGNPVALEAKAELRETRGLTSITLISLSLGLTAYCTLAPPPLIPIARITFLDQFTKLFYS